jgi:hypothetical protein
MKKLREAADEANLRGWQEFRLVEAVWDYLYTAELQDATKWRPIDTAPLGIDVLTYSPNGEDGIDIAFKSNSETPWRAARCADGLNISTPTHWMPLPTTKNIGENP